jgi:hypothetical protein
MSDDSAAFSAQDAFELFGHDLRVSILLELAAAEGRSLSFSTLRERVGEADSGKFNYHLSKLDGRFVGQDPETEEYRLLYPGHHLIDTIQTGVYHEQARVENLSLAGRCGSCGGPVRFDYDTVTSGRVRCRDCETILLGYPFDPGGLRDREGAAIARAYDYQTRTAWECAHAGVCPVCSGVVGASFDDAVPSRLAATQGQPVHVAIDCTQCSYFVNISPGAILTWHPETVAFLTAQDVDVQDRRLWELPFVVDPDQVTVEAVDPWRVAVTVTAGDAERTAVFDDATTVTAVE